MNDTPRVDAAIADFYQQGVRGLPALARQLERELAAEKARADALAAQVRLDEKAKALLVKMHHNLAAQAAALREAAEEFVAKVERGEARSVRSYKKFLDALGRKS